MQRTIRTPPDVVFWTSDKGGGRFSRCEEPARALRLLGHEAVVTPLITESLRRAPVIVGHRLVTDKQSNGWRQMIEHRLPGQRFVADADDDYTAVDPINEGRTYALYSQDKTQDNIVQWLRLADRVTVCSGRLAEVYGRHNDQIIRTPNTLPVAVSRPAGARRRAAAPYVIGWAGSPSAHADLALIVPALKRWLARDRYATVHLVGAPALTVQALGVDDSRVRVTEWINGTANYAARIDFDVWLAPYRDTPFNRGKFPTKIMESAVLGIPLIASDVGAYHQGGPGVLLTGNSDKEWFQALRAAADLSAWRRMRDAKVRASGAQHLTECNAPRWEEVLLT